MVACALPALAQKKRICMRTHPGAHDTVGLRPIIAVPCESPTGSFVWMLLKADVLCPLIQKFHLDSPHTTMAMINLWQNVFYLDSIYVITFQERRNQALMTR